MYKREVTKVLNYTVSPLYLEKKSSIGRRVVLGGGEKKEDVAVDAGTFATFFPPYNASTLL